MKKLIYLCSALALVSSFTLAGKSYAAHTTKALVNVRLCSSAPVGIGGDQHIAQGIFNGVATAEDQDRPAFRKAGINLLSPLTMDDAKADGSAVDAAKEASNARKCLGTSNAYGYIGTLNSSMAQVSEPLLNKGGMLQISPANSNPILTTPSARSIYEPFTFSHTLKYPTYYRVVTTDSLQGPMGAIYMGKVLHIKTFYLVDDQQTYGAGLAKKMAAYAKKYLHMTEVGSGHLDTSSTSATATSADAVAKNIVAKNPQAVYCGCDEPYSGPMLKAARRAGYKGSYVGGDAIQDNSFGTFAGGNANLYKTYCTFVGNPNAVPASYKNLSKRYFPGWRPGPYDALAYDASRIALSAVLKSFKAHTLTKGTLFQRRSSILKYVATTRYHGTIGTITFDRNGDTTLRVISVWRWSGSAWKFTKVYSSGHGIPGFLTPTP